MALGSSQPLTEMGTRNISLGVKTASATADNLAILKSGSLNLLGPSGLVQACNGIAWPFAIIRKHNRWMKFRLCLKSSTNIYSMPSRIEIIMKLIIMWLHAAYLWHIFSKDQQKWCNCGNAICQEIIKIAWPRSGSCYKWFIALFNFRQVILKENAGGYVWRNVSAVLRYNENGKVFTPPLMSIQRICTFHLFHPTLIFLTSELRRRCFFPKLNLQSGRRQEIVLFVKVGGLSVYDDAMWQVVGLLGGQSGPLGPYVLLASSSFL